MNDLSGMHRKPDHETSIKAAGKVRRFTLREQVIEFAKASLAHGFTDDDLKAAWPDKPESSLRKRRTELAQENVLVANGFERTNRHGQDEKVWVHRDFHPSPPDVVERDVASKQSKLARLEAQVRLLREALRPFTVALPEGMMRAMPDNYRPDQGSPTTIADYRRAASAYAATN